MAPPAARSTVFGQVVQVERAVCGDPGRGPKPIVDSGTRIVPGVPDKRRRYSGTFTMIVSSGAKPAFS